MRFIKMALLLFTLLVVHPSHAKDSEASHLIAAGFMGAAVNYFPCAIARNVEHREQKSLDAVQGIALFICWASLNFVSLCTLMEVMSASKMNHIAEPCLMAYALGAGCGLLPLTEMKSSYPKKFEEKQTVKT